jgi:hypothetical protein
MTQRPAYEQRLQEASDHIQHGKHRSAVESAGGGIDLLMKALFDELKGKLNRHDAAALQAAYNKLAPSSGKAQGKLTFGGWIRLYEDEKLFARLEGAFGYKFRYFNAGTLNTILEVRNDCVHEDYQPTSAESELVRNNLVLFLRETNRAPKEAEAVLPQAKPERARGKLSPWTAVTNPNRDIRERRFDLGIFAIHLGEIAEGQRGQAEYADPETFFDLTYLTRGLRSQLISTMQRLTGSSRGASVVQLDTTFGGGKTHTLLAMYHLARYGASLAERSDVRSLMNEARIEALPDSAVAVLDGSHLTPSQPRTTPEGLTLRTLWGEMAYQLGGAEGYEFLRQSDETMSAPGAREIGDLLAALGRPSLILIDELLDYATKAAAVKVGRGYLVDQTQSFLKALTQAVDRNSTSMLVLTLTSSPQQIFGEQARRVQQQVAELYATFKNILDRVQRSEVTAESVEIYEILRRRLFESIGDGGTHKQVAAAYWDYYRQHQDRFPQAVLDPTYRDRIAASYPFHPELIDVLRDRWGTIQGFQRTRGVLRLLALVVSNLYRKNHGAPLIQVGHIDLADPEIRRELLSHVDSPAGYDSAIGSDIAGLDTSKAESMDQQIGGDYYRFGLCEGLATTLFMYSHSGAGGFIGGTQPQLYIGILQPDLPPATASDTYLKLDATLWYMEKEGALSRIGVDPNLNMMLVQRMDALRQHTDKLYEYIYTTIESLAGSKFGKAIIWPDDSRLVRDSNQLKLIVAPLHASFSQDNGLEAQAYADDILRNAGDKHRQFRNTLIFVMPTVEGVTVIQQAAIKLMALEDIEQATGRQLKDRQRDELQQQLAAARVGLPAAVWGAYVVTLTANRNDDFWIAWESGIKPYRQNDTLSQRVWERLIDGERLLEKFDPDFIMRRSDERFAYLWPADREYVNTQVLCDTFARYDYLPMLASPRVLQDTIAWGVQRGLFAYCTGNPENYQFDRIRIDEMVRAEECVISEYAWLLSAERARALLAPPPPPDYVEPTVPDDDSYVEPEPRDDYDQTRRGEAAINGIHVEVQLAPLDWRQFYNSVIQPLVAKGANVNITVNLAASHTEGFDLDFIELSIRESVVQINRTARIDIQRQDND